MRIRVAVSLLMAVGLLSLPAAAACGGDSADSGQGERVQVGDGAFTRLDPAELVTFLEDNPDAIFVNVHIPYAGEIPGTTAFVPFDEMESFGDLTGADRESLVVIYCRSGSMSTQAAEDLVGLGYQNVVELGGGMVAWENAGHQLTDAGQ